MDASRKLQGVRSLSYVEIGHHDPHIGPSLKDAPHRLRALRLDDFEACLAQEDGHARADHRLMLYQQNRRACAKIMGFHAATPALVP